MSLLFLGECDHDTIFYFFFFIKQIFLVAYIHNRSLQPFSQDYNLVNHTTYVVCVNFIHEWWNLQFKVDSERQIFGKLSMAILFTLRDFARHLLRGSRRRNIFIFVVKSDLGFKLEPYGLISQHTTS